MERIDGWSDKDLHTLVVTAGEIASYFGTGPDGLNRDDILSRRQLTMLARAVAEYRRYTRDDEDDEPGVLILVRVPDGLQHDPAVAAAIAVAAQEYANETYGVNGES